MKKKSPIERFFSYLTTITVLSVISSLLYSVFFLELSMFLRILMGLSAAVIFILFVFLHIANKISRQTVDALENLGKNR